jgi:hypothetical protein
MAAAAGVLLLAQVGDITTLGRGGGGGGARGGGRLFSRESLAEFDGVRRPEMYVAILGEVFDVSSKPQFYGPPKVEEQGGEEGGGEGPTAAEQDRDLGYRVFVGRDGTRAFSTGEFTLRNATDRVVDVFGGEEEEDKGGEAAGRQPHPPQPALPPEQLLELTEWLDFYRRTYPHRGVLAGGSFYDTSGQPKKALALVRAGAARGVEVRAERERARRARAAARPACETKWTAEEGGELWCPDAKRPYPRRVKEVEVEEGVEEAAGAKGGGLSPGAALKRRAERRRRERAGWRCVCFEEVGWSDLRQVYSGCPPEASRCKIV